MTRYFLYGGATRKNKAAAEKFFREALNAAEKNEINFLLVYFAKPKEKWEERIRMDELFISALTNKKIKFVVGDEDLFSDQAKLADVVYLQGGDGTRIKDALKKYDVEKLFNGKIIVGNSAGVNVLSRYYYDNDYDRIEEGLGVLPIKTVCHYRSEIEEKLNELKIYKEELETFAIPECEYITKEAE